MVWLALDGITNEKSKAGGSRKISFAVTGNSLSMRAVSGIW